MNGMDSEIGVRTRRRFVSLRTKLIGFVSLIIIVICSVLGWYFIRQRVEFMNSSLLNTGAILAKNLAHNEQFGYGIKIENQEILKPFVDSVLEVDEVAYVVITGSEGLLLAAESKGKVYPDPAFARAAFRSASSEPIITSFKIGRAHV